MKKLVSILVVVLALMIIGCSKSELEAPLHNVNQKSLSTSEEKPSDVNLTITKGGNEEGGGGISDDEDEDDDEGKNTDKGRGDLN